VPDFLARVVWERIVEDVNLDIPLAWATTSLSRLAIYPSVRNWRKEIPISRSVL
jgi:hypothetical protein